MEGGDADALSVVPYHPFKVSLPAEPQCMDFLAFWDNGRKAYIGSDLVLPTSLRKGSTIFPKRNTT